MFQLKFLFYPGTYCRLLSRLFHAMLCCFGFDNERQQALELEVDKLRLENITINREYRGKLEHVQKQHKKLEKKASELESELQITGKLYEEQIRLSDDLKKRLLSCDEQLKVFRRQSHTHEVEIQYLKQQYKRTNEENCKLREQISSFTSSQEYFEKRESEYKEVINKLRQGLQYFVKQDEIRSEENLTLTKKSKELEALHSLEKQKNLTYSQHDLCEKNTNSLDCRKSKSLADLNVLQETTVPYIHTKQESDSGGNIVNEKLQQQIQILKQQLLEEAQQNEILKNLEKAYYEDQINVLQNELVGYKQKVNILTEQIDNLNKIYSTTHPETEINETASWARLQSSPNSDTLKEGTLIKYEELDLDTRKSLNIIDEIYEATAKLEKDITEFSGGKEDKQFLHLNELLMRNVVNLDNVESGGEFMVREKRKEAIQYVQKLHGVLNDKVK